MAKRIRYYEAESERLVYCGECFADLFRNKEQAVANLGVAEDIVREMQARLATWRGLLNDSEREC